MALSRSEAEHITRLFLRDYPRAAVDLAYMFRRNTTELYGPNASGASQSMKGGYLPKEIATSDGRKFKGSVHICLENITDARDFLLTLRHEVLGHYGVNTFHPAEKRALLDGVIAGREEPTLKPFWEDINARYAGMSLDIRAEEVIALKAEDISPRHHHPELSEKAKGQVQERGQQSLMETCIARIRPMKIDDLHNIICMVAEGLRDKTRMQQTFPEINELSRKKIEKSPDEDWLKPKSEKISRIEYSFEHPDKERLMQYSQKSKPEKSPDENWLKPKSEDAIQKTGRKMR
ncbi:hypothetical protein P9911_029400 [Klebsiella oxytoca]|uniref:hypothetical protein n=1 Tax=Klebsiella oxytoca TaxID=571 RepID=UPI00254D0459|nr:hypothetical protein [Klebsiella oxytoca]MEC5509921.1 hypothetical protein [Klebsiella oxytoca]